MMRRALLASLCILAPVSAQAQTSDVGQGRLDISGQAPSACLISAPTSATGANTSFQSTGAQQGQITINQLADAQTATPIASSINLALPIICNTAHTLTISTSNGGLLRLGGVVGPETNGFRQFLPYRVGATWAGQTANATSQAGATITINASDGAAGQLNLEVSTPGGGDPLVAGSYSDELVIQLRVAS